jgi:hypothetical protein
VGIPAGREKRKILSLLDGDDAAEGDEIETGLPAGRGKRKILSLLDGDGAAEGDERGTGLPAGRGKRKILSLLDGISRIGGWDDGVRGRIGREAAGEMDYAREICHHRRRGVKITKNTKRLIFNLLQ